MRGDKVALLISDAKRRPEIAALVARAAFMTEEEIDAAEVPLPWYRVALKELRARERHAAALARFEEQLAGMDEQPVRKPITGHIREWTCDVVVKIDRGGELIQQAGKLFFVPFGGDGVWYETTFTSIKDPQIERHSIDHGIATRESYIDAYKAKQMRYCTDSTQIIDLTGGKSGGLAGIPGVRIG